jgi:hypothetical protein
MQGCTRVDRLSTAGQRFNRGSFRGQGPEVAAPENDELRNRLLRG